MAERSHRARAVVVFDCEDKKAKRDWEQFLRITLQDAVRLYQPNGPVSQKIKFSIHTVKTGKS